MEVENLLGQKDCKRTYRTKICFDKIGFCFSVTKIQFFYVTWISGAICTLIQSWRSYVFQFPHDVPIFSSKFFWRHVFLNVNQRMIKLILCKKSIISSTSRAWGTWPISRLTSSEFRACPWTTSLVIIWFPIYISKI